MKHYTVKAYNHWLGEYMVTVFNEDGVEEHRARVGSCAIEGYCQCLADMGYCYFINGVNHGQFI